MRITRRELLANASAAGLALVADAFSFACAQEARGPRAVALCIGLNRVNPAHYGGTWDGKLGGCHADQEVMHQIATSKGFTVRCLRDQHATRDNIKNSIAYAATHLDRGDIFMVSNAGHGSHRTDQENEVNEPDKQDECWCVYDGLLFDDELFQLWTKFKPGVRILVISDTCHSGTIARVAAPQLARRRADTFVGTRDTAVARALPDAAKRYDALTDQLAAGEIPRDLSPIREMPEAIRQSMLGNVAAARFYAEISRQLLPKAQLRAACTAAVLSIGAARDDEYALDIGSNGLFSYTLNNVWKGGGFANYQQFRDEIARRLAGRQTPQIDRFGPGADVFLSQMPFAV